MGIFDEGILKISSSFNRIRPVVGVDSLVISFNRVVLPAPDWPTIKTNSPESIFRLISSSAIWPPGNDLDIDSNTNMGQKDHPIRDFAPYSIISTLPTSINQPTWEEPNVSPKTLTFLPVYSSRSKTEEVKYAV